jgi:hypothetical protein
VSKNQLRFYGIKNMDEKNGTKNGAEKAQTGKELPPERDRQGRFLNLPGPGRSKKVFKPMTIDDVELALSQDLRSDDPKVRLPATRLLLQLKRQFPEQDDSQVLHPFTQRVLGFICSLHTYYKEKTGRLINAEEAFDLMEEHIKQCPNSPIIIDEMIEVDDDC